MRRIPLSWQKFLEHGHSLTKSRETPWGDVPKTPPPCCLIIKKVVIIITLHYHFFCSSVYCGLPDNYVEFFCSFIKKVVILILLSCRKPIFFFPAVFIVVSPVLSWEISFCPTFLPFYKIFWQGRVHDPTSTFLIGSASFSSPAVPLWSQPPISILAHILTFLQNFLTGTSWWPPDSDFLLLPYPLAGFSHPSLSSSRLFSSFPIL